MNRFAAIITAILLLSLVFTSVISQPADAASQHYILAKVKTADGLPLAGVTITARNVSTGSPNQSYSLKTDSNGSALIPVTPGLYNITATLKGYVANTTYTDANLQAGNFSSPFTMIATHGNLTGFVTNGIITVANATVTLSNTTSGNSTISYSTHSTAPLGKYSISGIPAGKYNVSAVKKGYIINDTAIYILPGSQIWMNFTLTPILGEIIGIVNTTTGSGAGRPLGSANVTITGTGGTFRTVTNANGIYEVTNIPQGTYTIKVQKNGYLPGQGSVTISVSRVTYLNFTVLALSHASLLPIYGFIGKLDLDHSLMFVALVISIVVVAGTVTLLNKTYNWREESEENEEGGNKGG
jgi:hypothetical protein